MPAPRRPPWRRRARAAAGCAVAAVALLAAEGCFVAARLGRELRPRPRGVAVGATRVAVPPTAVEEDVDVPEATAVRGGLPALEDRPGSRDGLSFNEGPSVGFWRNFDPYDPEAGALPGLADLTGEDAAYWLYHIGRTGFFAVQAATGVLASELLQRVSAAAAEGPAFVARLLEDPGREVRGRLQEAAAAFKQDLRYIRDGLYKAPFDMSPRHRQWSPLYVTDRSFRFVKEAVATLQRSREKADTRTWVGAGSDIYPPYYQHTFHYQTDGWLSSESAEVYETSTETLFLGRQDAMQRTTLVHIARFLQRRQAAERASGASGRPPRLLELACGTGRVMTFIRDNWPEMDVTASDLSPFYLEKARENNAYWERRFAPAARGTASFVQANAEALPFADASFDLVTSVYLFHELPESAQNATLAEVARVLAPGGVFVLTDSVQLGDRLAYDQTMGNFGSFAEPFYRAYIRRDLAAAARRFGLEPLDKEVASSTKSVSFLKPMRGGGGSSTAPR